MRKVYYRPPWIFRRLFRLLVPRSQQYYLSGDFNEIYTDIRKERGRLAAAFWFLGQLFFIFPRILFNSFKWSVIMLQNYFKLILRKLRRQRGYSFINIAGLSVGMACFILILLFTQYEFSYEKHNPNADRVYRVYIEHHHPEGIYRVNASPVPLAKALGEEIPEVLDYTRLNYVGRRLVAFEDLRFYETGVVFADPGVFDILGFVLLSGDKKTALKEPESAIITREIAQKYFKDEEPVGKTLLFDNSYSIKITGVIQDYPPNTDFGSDILVSFSTMEKIAGNRYTDNWLSQVLQSYIMLPAEHSVSVMEDKIAAVFEKYKAENDSRVLHLEQLSTMHLHSPGSSGNILYIYIFLAVGLLILLTACINFMNLSTARSANRAKEVGLRKVVGAARSQLIKQFMGESLFFAALSMLVALGLAYAFLPALTKLTEQSLSFSQLGQPWILFSMLGVVLLVGLLSGSYPALFLSAFQPVRVLKGSLQQGAKGSLFRKILVVSQFTISIFLILSTMILGRQLNYLRNKSPGFQKDQIVVIRNQGQTALGNIEPFKLDISNNAKVLGVTGSAMLPSGIGRYNNVTWEGAPDDKVIAINHNTVDYDFLATYELELLAGRNFSRDFSTDARRRNLDHGGALIINETAADVFGWEDPIGKKVIQTFGDLRINLEVIGVVKDFHYSSLKNAIAPMKLFLGNENYHISVKIHPQDVAGTISFLENAWERFNPNYPMEYFFLDSVFANRYQTEQRLQTLFSYFSLLAIFIACLGLFGLASYAAEQRTKEIGIRKVMGAQVAGIVALLSKEFSKWVLIANIVAWPLAYYIMFKWLQGFAYHVNINAQWPLFLLAAVIALLIAWLTVGYQALKAALTNPVNALRYE